MNIDSAFPSKYLKASDLKGAQPVVSIERVEFEPVGQTREMRPVVYFAGKEKGLVLNKTNSKAIVGIAGTSETDEWHGIQVKLYATMVEFSGESVEAIRVKSAPPVAAKRKPEPEPVAEDFDADAIPF